MPTVLQPSESFSFQMGGMYKKVIFIPKKTRMDYLKSDFYLFSAENPLINL